MPDRLNRHPWPRLAGRPHRVAGALALAAALAGCGLWLGENEVILEGERIPIRTATPQAAAERNSAPIPPTTPVADWPQAGGSAQRTIGHAAGSSTLERVWSRSIGAGSGSESRVTAPPVAAGGVVYALDAASRVSAFSAAGERLWRADLAPDGEDGRDGFAGGLAVTGGSLIAATGFGEIVSLDRSNGERRWTFAAEAPIRAAPAVSGGRAVVVTRDGTVIAVNVADGSEAWRLIGMEGGAGMMAGGGSAPAISGEVVAAPFSTGDISIMRLRDGRRGWSEPIGGMTRGAGISVIADVTSAPVMSQGRIYAGGVSGRLVAFEIPTGRRIWARDIGAYNPVWVAGDSLFVVTEDARLMALSASTGLTIWETPLDRFDDPEDREGAFAYGGPILVGGKLVLVSTDRKIFRFDAVSGTLEAEERLPGPSAIPPITAGGLIFVVDEDGDLHAYR